MIDPQSAIQAVEHLDQYVGLLKRLVGRLRAQPDIAAAQLSAALNEIAKTYVAVDEGIIAYASVALDHDDLRQDRGNVMRIAGGSLAAWIADARGHCSTIQNIYSRHLSGWFERVLDKREQSEIHRIFEELWDYDQHLFFALQDVAYMLTEDAATVVRLLMLKNDAEAVAHVINSYRTLLPLQRVLSTALTRLFELKDEFIQIAALA